MTTRQEDIGRGFLHANGTAVLYIGDAMVAFVMTVRVYFVVLPCDKHRHASGWGVGHVHNGDLHNAFV